MKKQLVYRDFANLALLNFFIHLYPHDTDNFILIAPRRFQSKIEYDHILKSPLILVWAPVVAMVAIMRFLFNKFRKTDKKLVDISLQTFGLSLGMSFNATISTAAENLLLWCFCLATMLSGMLLSSSMFQGFALQLDILTINNLEELETSGLAVQVPMHIALVEHFFANIPQKLKLNFIMQHEISDMIQSRNTSNAYVIRERYEHLSYKVHFFAAVENPINTVIQRCVNHGIVKYLKEKNMRLLTGIKPSDKKRMTSNVEPLSVNDMKHSLFLLAVGLALSADRRNTLYSLSSLNLNSEQLVYRDFANLALLNFFIHLYPHDTDNFILIAPRRFQSKIEYDHILKSPLILVWAPVVAMVAIIRFIFNKFRKTDKKLVNISLQTFGLSLGMSFNATISTAAENLLLWCFCLATMLSGMLLSSSMFQGFALQLDILTINNLEELETSGLAVQVPMHIESVEHFFANIPQKLKLNFIMQHEISDMIQSRNTSNAYVIRERYEHVSYKVHFFAAVENPINTVIQRCVNHGIVKYLKEKNMRLLTGIKSSDKKQMTSNVEPLSVNDLKHSLFLLAVGLALSA
ncbi:hypothetical protein Bhyg_08848, partial [Pseudolycoriella hygida]